MAEKLLSAAIKHLNAIGNRVIKASQIIKWRVVGDEIIILVNLGIAGVPKYRLAIKDIEPELEPAPKPKPKPKRQTRRVKK